MKQLVCLLFCIAMFSSWSSNVIEPTVEIIQIHHDCNGESNGSIELEIDYPNGYTFYWTHGSHDLNQYNLSAGVYILIIEDEFGCEYDFTYTILSIQDAFPLIPDDVEYSCETGLGSIQIIADVSGFTFEWSNDATTISQDNLLPGTYILTLISTNGCEQLYVFVVEEQANCTFEVNNYATNCHEYINITVDTPDPTLVNAVWEDGETGLSRVFDRTNATYEVCVTITTGDQCCSYQACWLIEATIVYCGGPGEGGPKDIKLGNLLIVNEWANSSSVSDGTKQFIELLVVGEFECGANSDIRGYYIDDHGGDLFLASEEITADNFDYMGIDEGYIKFTNHQQWSQINNGSIILLYETLDGITADPYDTNNDDVYVIDVNQASGLFTGYQALFDTINQEITYSDNNATLSASFSHIIPTQGMDVIHVRTTDMSVHHGLGIGQNAYVEEYSFPIRLSEYKNNYANGLVKDQPLNPTHFSNEIDPTPGLSNSTENEALISSLLNCPIGQRERSERGEIEHKVMIAPNPTVGSFVVDIKRTYEQVIRVEILDNKGQKINELRIPEGSQSIRVEKENFSSSGIYFVLVQFPDGERIPKKVIITH